MIASGDLGTFNCITCFSWMLQISGNNTQNPYFSHSFSLLLSISCLVFPPSQPLMSLTSWRRAQGGGYGDGRLVLVILLGGNNSMCLLSICRNCQEHNIGEMGIVGQLTFLHRNASLETSSRFYPYCVCHLNPAKVDKGLEALTLQHCLAFKSFQRWTKRKSWPRHIVYLTSVMIL